MTPYDQLRADVTEAEADHAQSVRASDKVRADLDTSRCEVTWLRQLRGKLTPSLFVVIVQEPPTTRLVGPFTSREQATNWALRTIKTDWSVQVVHST